MDLKVEFCEGISGRITPSPSKFYTQFSTVTSLLADGKSTIEFPLLVDDTRTLVNAIETLGATTKRSQNKWSIWGTGRSINPNGQVIDAKKSITSLSLLSPLSAFTSRMMVITGKSQIRSISISSLIDGLRQLGVDVHSTKSDDSPPLVCFGGEVLGGKISLGEDFNLHFLPALLLTTPLAKGKVQVELAGGFESSIVDMAVDIMKKRGIELESTKDLIEITPGDYETLNVKPPLDLFSTFPYLTAAILTDSEVKIMKIDEANNVEEFTSLLDRLGVDFEVGDHFVLIKSDQDLRGKEYNLSDYPELIPFTALIACSATGSTKITGCDRARSMKSDRIISAKEELEKMGADIEQEDDGLIIKGPTKLGGNVVNGRGDDVMVSALGVGGMAAEGETVVKNRAEILRESYPRFVSNFKNLGAKMRYSS